MVLACRSHLRCGRHSELLNGCPQMGEMSKDNQARLQLFALAYNLGNFLRRLALPRSVKHWSLTTLREKLIKIGAKVVRHAKYVMFQMAEVAVPRELFVAILERIRRFGVPPPLVQCE